MSFDVLLTHPSADLYGSDRMALETVRALISEGLSVQVVLPKGGPLSEELLAAGATVLFHNAPVLRKTMMTPWGIARYFLKFVSGVWAGRRIIRRSGARLTYVNTIVQPTWVLGSWLAHVPSVLHVREAEPSSSWLLRWGLTFPARFATAIIANSSATRDAMVASASSVARRTSVVHNGKDWSPYFSRPFSGVRSPIRILYFGRLSPRKGVDLALDACSLLIAWGHPAHLTIAGGVYEGYEWYEAELREKAARLGTPCEFLGFVENPRDLLGDADCVLVPSRQEPFGTTAAEAMAAMRPVIVADVGGLPEVVTDHVTGMVVPPDDPKALAHACEELINSPALADRIARAGYDDVIGRLSQRAYVDGIMDVVSSTLARDGAR